MSRDLAAGRRITVRQRGTGQYTEEGIQTHLLGGKDSGKMQLVKKWREKARLGDEH
jgi:hypothetical protein